MKQFLRPQPEFNFGPLWARQRNATQMALCWWTDSGPILRAYCDILLLPLIQKDLSVTSESIIQSTGYPVCEACPGKKCGYGN